MYDIIGDLLAAFRATPDTLRGLLRGVDEQQAQRARGGDEGWSVVEVVCHLRDVEERAIERMRAIRDEDNPRIAGYDQEQWAAERDYAASQLDDALAAFLSWRAVHLAELAVLPAADWQRTGDHEEAGEISIFSHTLHLVSHDAVHLAQISRQLQGIAPA